MNLQTATGGALRGPLQALDEALADTHPARHEAARMPDDLDTACRELRLALTNLGAALCPLLACITGTDTAPGVLRLRQDEVDRRVELLVELYHGIARMSLRTDGTAEHERLLDGARDALVLLAHGLAAIVAAAQCGRTASAELSFQLPDDETDLAAWRPQRLAYDRAAVARAISGSAGIGDRLELPAGVDLVVSMADPAAGPATAEPDYATRLAAVQKVEREAKELERSLFWTLVSVFTLGWWLGG